MEELEWRVARRHFTQRGEFLLLLSAHNRNVAHLLVGLLHHALNHGSNALRNCVAQSLGVDGVVILHHDASRLYLDVNLELRNIQLEQFLSYCLTVDSVLRQHAHLVGIGDSRPEAIVGSDAGKGVILVAQGLVEGLAGVFEEAGNRHVVNADAQWQSVDKHAHGVGNLEVGTSAAHGAQEDLAVIGVARHHIGCCSEKQMGRGHLLTAAIGSNLVVVDGTHRLAYQALDIALGQVARNLAGTLAGGKSLGEELLRLLERAGVLGSLLVGDEVEIRISFLLHPVALESSANLANEQVGRAAIKEQVVHVKEQMHATRRCHHLKAIERGFLQVEGTHKLVLVAVKLLVAHVSDGHCNRHFAIDGLHYLVALGGEMHAQFGMAFYHTLHRIGELLGIDALGIRQQVGDVIDSRCGILQALEVHASLCIGQWHSGRSLALAGGCCCSFLACQEVGEDVVLDGLQCASLDKALRVERHAIALVDLNGESNRRYRRESGIAQRSGDAKLGVAHNLGDNLVQLLLEHVHGHVALLDDSGSLLLGLGQRALVHLLVLVERNGVDLHRHGRNHVGWLLVEDEVVERLDVDGRVAHDVGSDKLAATFLVKGLNRCVLDARELADDAFHLLELDAETANLHLAVAASHKLNVATGQIAHNVAGAIDAAVFLAGGEGIVDIHLGCLLGTVEVATAHLWTRNPQFACCAHWKPVSLRVNDVEPHVVEWLANGDVFQALVHMIGSGEDGALGGTIAVVEFITCWWVERCQLLAASAQVLERVVLDACGKLISHLRGHE